MTSTQSMMLLLGRIMMATLFIVAGIRKALVFSASTAYMAKNGVPMPEPLLVLTLTLEIGGGLLLILGWKTRWIASALAIFVLIITPIFHAFWTFEGAQYAAQLNNLLKNVAVIGGLIYFIVFGPGAMSVDERNGRNSRTAPAYA